MHCTDQTTTQATQLHVQCAHLNAHQFEHLLRTVSTHPGCIEIHTCFQTHRIDLTVYPQQIHAILELISTPATDTYVQWQQLLQDKLRKAVNVKQQAFSFFYGPHRARY